MFYRATPVTKDLGVLGGGVFFLFYFPLENFSLTWRRTAKCRSMPGAYDLCAQRDLYRATPAVTRGRGFCSTTHRQSPIVHGI